MNHKEYIYAVIIMRAKGNSRLKVHKLNELFFARLRTHIIDFFMNILSFISRRKIFNQNFLENIFY